MKKIKLVCILLFVLSVSISINKLWAINVVEESGVHISRGPYLQLGTPNSIVIRWRTLGSTDSRVKFGLQPDLLDQEVIVNERVKDHEVLVDGLEAGTKYYYAIGTSEQILSEESEAYYFITSPEPSSNQKVILWLLGDQGQGGLESFAIDGAGRRAREVRDAFYNYIGDRHVDAIITSGDNAYNIGLDTMFQTAMFEGMYEDILKNTVIWPSLGNHDTESSDSVKQTGPYFDIFSLPTNAEAGGVASNTESYYSFDYANIHFICIDTTVSDEDYRNQQIAWLQSDLQQNRADWLIAYFHHAPHSKGSHDSDQEGLMASARAVSQLLEAAGVDLIFAGHSHNYERSYLLDGFYDVSENFSFDENVKDGGNGVLQRDRPLNGDGAYAKPTLGPAPNEGTVYLVTGSSSKLAREHYGLMHPAMIRQFGGLNGLLALGSVVLEIDGNQLSAIFLDNEGVVQDNFNIVKGNDVPRVVITMNKDIYQIEEKPIIRLYFKPATTDQTVDVLVRIVRQDLPFLYLNQQSEFMVEKDIYISQKTVSAKETQVIISEQKLEELGPGSYTMEAMMLDEEQIVIEESRSAVDFVVE